MSFERELDQHIKSQEELDQKIDWLLLKEKNYFDNMPEKLADYIQAKLAEDFTYWSIIEQCAIEENLP